MRLRTRTWICRACIGAPRSRRPSWTQPRVEGLGHPIHQKKWMKHRCFSIELFNIGGVTCKTFVGYFEIGSMLTLEHFGCQHEHIQEIRHIVMIRQGFVWWVFKRHGEKAVWNLSDSFNDPSLVFFLEYLYEYMEVSINGNPSHHLFRTMGFSPTSYWGTFIRAGPNMLSAALTSWSRGFG